ncbi:PAS domain S-box protein [Acidisphaera sp. L21]|uniref:PAS domain S-box protein n=1 Tax=Acidisphaera sp. L21 TaxID=1641851 RepID=UPI00131EC019|nr:PAS domain S-box protein [Acidisphaera sp. L21]
MPWIEDERLAALDRTGLLDTPPEQAFDDLVRLAADMLGMPMAAIHLVARDRQFGKSQIGLDAREMPRSIAFCPHAMLAPDGLVVPDATVDPLFADNPLVTGQPGIRFYAGAPLQAEGLPIGALCVIDTKPHAEGLSEQQRFVLKTLAAQVSSQIALRRAVSDRDALLTARSRSEALRRQTLNSATDFAIFSTDLEGAINGWNAGAEAILGWSEAEMLGQNAERIFTPEDSRAGAMEDERATALSTGRAADERWHVRKGGERFWASGEMMPLRDDTGVVVGLVKVLRDRTEQHLAGQRMAQSEARYRTLFEAIDAGFCVIELGYDAAGQPNDYRFAEVNPAFERQTGLVDAVGRWVRELIPDHEQYWFETYGRVVATGEAVRFENHAVALGRWYEVHAFRVGQPGDERVAVLFNNITDRKEADQALQRSEAHWRGLFERLEEGFILGELVREGDRAVAWRYLEVNPAWGRMMGVLPNAAVGHTIREILPGIEDAWVDEMARVVETGRTATFLRQVGALDRWYEGRAHRVDDNRFAVIFQEVTDRQKAERRRMALLDLGDRLRDMQDPAEMSYLAAEIIGPTIGADRAGYSLMTPDNELATVERDWVRPGLPSIAGDHTMRDYGSFIDDLVQGNHVLVEDVASDPRTAAWLSKWEATGVRAFINLPLVEQGRLVALIFAYSASPRAWSAEEVSFARNVAERTLAAIARRRAEDELRRLNASLEDAVQARTSELLEASEQLRQSQKMEAVGQLTGGIAHDFNNLLTGIVGSLELMSTRLGQGRVADLPRYVQAARGAADRAAALTHRLLAFSRRQTLDPRPTALNPLMHGMEDLVRRTIGPLIDLQVTGAAGLWTTLCDPNQLENALLNLCINARDAMPGGGHLTIEAANTSLDARAARAADLPPGPYVVMSVTDTGCGMPQDVIARAFDPFFTTKPLGQGTGLGLSMVYGFARQSGGQVRIYSEPDRGTTIKLYLPRHDGEAEVAPMTGDLNAAPHAPAHETVLVVDDEPTVRMLIGEVLHELNYATVEAADGATGLQILNSDARIDLLVTDVGLPGGMNGRQLADAARIGRPTLKVLFITGFAENAVIGSGMLEPGMQVMTKPFSMEAMAAKVRDLINQG